MTDYLTIDCRTCIRLDTESCDDCMMTFLDNPQSSRAASGAASGAVVIHVADFAALRRLESAGMVPGLRHQGIG